ncbi:14920_t:CDS:1, partial [Funneliformis geosporum]
MSRMRQTGSDRRGDNKPNIQEIKRLQRETATANFSSSELSYKG